MLPKTIRSVIFVAALVCFQPVYADEWDDAVAAYNAGKDEIALPTFLEFANQGNAEAQTYVGVIYQNGGKYHEALEWYRKAAEQNEPDGQRNLGALYEMGYVVKKDYGKAVKLYRKAAEQGDSDAQYNLGKMYLEGKGVIQDYVQAHAWHNLAASLGNFFGKHSRDFVASYMTPEQIAEAQALAREWTAKYNKQNE